MSDDHAHGAHGADDHGHGDDHGHEVAADFIPESSGYDKLVGLFAILAGLGLITMMVIWATTPMAEVAAEHEGGAAQVEHAAEPGQQQPTTEEHK